MSWRSLWRYTPPDWVHHNPSDTERIEKLTRYMTEVFEAVSDLEFTITVTVVEDDAVTVFWTMSDIHDGSEFVGSQGHVRP